MPDANWVQIGISLLGIAVIAGVFVGVTKSDPKLLALRLDIVDSRLERMDRALQSLVETKARLDIIDERMLQQGKRVDDNARRLTTWIEEVYNERHDALLERMSRVEHILNHRDG